MTKKLYNFPSWIGKILYAREAAAVQRLHTIQHIGTYDNGQHTFNMLVMLRLMYHPGEPRIELVWAIMGHDLGERLVGDVPAPSKWAVPELSILAEVEERITTLLHPSFTCANLTSDELKWLKGLDLLELYLWGRDQQMLGSKRVDVMMNRIMQYQYRADFPAAIKEMFLEAMVSKIKCMPDLGE